MGDNYLSAAQEIFFHFRLNKSYWNRNRSTTTKTQPRKKKQSQHTPLPTMPRFFDDYSNTYLTHDSAAGRKQQRRGWKFRENFKLHYQKHIVEWQKGGMGLASAQQGYIRARGKDDPLIPPLPDGWEEDADECTGISFYYNDETGARTWVRPNFIPPPRKIFRTDRSKQINKQRPKLSGRDMELSY